MQKGCMRKRYTAADQQQFLNEVRESGQSAEAVARRFGIAKSTAYKWQQRDKATSASSKSSPKLTFARVLPQSRSAVFVQVGGATVRVETGFDAELLRGVVAALGEGKQ